MTHENSKYLRPEISLLALGEKSVSNLEETAEPRRLLQNGYAEAENRTRSTCMSGEKPMRRGS